MVKSLNQNQQLFVASGFSEEVSNASNVGALGVNGAFYSGDTNPVMYFVMKGADTVIKSDYIPVKNISYIKATRASDMEEKLKVVTVTADANPIAGQDYVLRIVFRQFYGMSDQDQYIKDVAVRVTSGMSKGDLYGALEVALNKAFSREVGATASANPYLTFDSDSDGLYITEKVQDSTLGIGAPERVYFDVFPTTIYTGGDDVIWGTTTVSEGDVISNGKKIAELEWFLAGERGDQYRMVGYPNYIPTTYLADPTKHYSTIDIHYTFNDTGVNSYASEKDITIAVPDTVGGTTPYDDINDIIAAINACVSSFGIEVDELNNPFD